MSYPGYPPYPQGPGQQPNQHVPPAYQETAPLSYPIYPGSGAPVPQGYPPYNTAQYAPSYSYPSQPYPPTGQQPQPYPPSSQQPQPYPPTSQQPQPYPPASQQPYPGYSPAQPVPYPGSASSQYPQPSMYPGGQAKASPYPLQPGGLPSQPGYPSAYPKESEPAHPTGRPSYPNAQTGGYSYGNSAADYPHSNSADYPTSNSAAYPGMPASHAPYPGAVPVLPSSAGVNTAHSMQSSQVPVNKGTPTVAPAVPFNPRGDAEILRKAMKGFGTDENAIIAVLTRRTNNQRLEIAAEFKSLYGKDLISDLKSELTGKLEDLILVLMTPIAVFLAREIHHAISGIGTNEETLVEILCTATNNDIRCISSAYQKVYGKQMERELSGDTGGNFRRLLISLCQGRRSENYMVDTASALQDAQTLLRAGELQLGTDESTFNAILCSRSYPQLNQIFMEYQKLSGHDFEKAVRNEFSGDIEAGLLAIVKSVRDRPGFFAEQLHKSMAGLGTKDRALIRILATRCEIDMVDIKRAFQAKYGKTLEDFVSGDSSGDYKKALLSLIA